MLLELARHVFATPEIILADDELQGIRFMVSIHALSHA